MSKLIRKMSILLCFVAVIFVGLNKVSAALPNTISGINGSETLNYNGYDQMIYKTYSNGVVFCAKFHIQGVGSSCTLSSSNFSVPTQAGVAAIVDKYNASASKQNYYNAELALNEFLYYFETKDSNNRISTNRDVRNTSGVKAYYDAAVNAYNNAKANFEVKLSTSSSKLDFTESDGYYVSNKITVSGTDKYAVSLSGSKDAKVYNQSGNSFYVRIPVDSVKAGETVTIKVTVNASKTIKVAKKYACGGNTQDVVPNITETTTKTSSASIQGDITKEEVEVTKLKISKQDITTKEELPGATLVLKDKKGNEIDKWVSTDKPHYIEGLQPGEYTLTETIAPKGYKLSEDTIEFTLEADGKIKEVIMYNTHESKYKVKISKQDITTKQELPGATLIIKDEEGNEIAKWVSGEEPHYLELEKGNYILTEIQAPNGYDLSYEVIKFTVGDNGEVETYVVMYNSKTPDTADKNIIFIVIAMAGALAGLGFSAYKLKHQK